jgi:hypothetical protein
MRGSAMALVALLALTAGAEEPAQLADGLDRPINWKLYAALVGNDLPAWAAEVDPAIGKRFEDAHDKSYQLQQLKAGLQRNPRLRSVFEEQRKRVSTMVLYADDNGALKDPCRRLVIYVGNELRLVFGESVQRGDPLALATIAPGCSQTRDSGLQLTAGRSPRYRCWDGVDETRCGWRLPDMPEELKRVVESDYPGSIRLRWRWRGLGANLPLRLDAFESGRSAANVAVPGELALQFLDARGQLLWTASGATLGRRAASP